MRLAPVPKQILGRKSVPKAMMDYQAKARIVREKTERLKALRLAKQATDKEHLG
jgi:hypothetical protein